MKQIVAKTLCLGALLGMVSSAQAITFTINAPQTSVLPAGGTSAWKVVLDTTDFISWTVTSITDALVPGQTPGNVNSITFTFFDGDGFTGSVLNGLAGGTGGVTTIGGTVASTAANPWQYDVSPSGFTATGLQTPLQSQNAGGTLPQFSGQFTLNGAAKSMVISLQGQPQQWQGTLATTVTPELPGSALLSVALLPLGLVIRKRMA
jgi:hypothetical protein